MSDKKMAKEKDWKQIQIKSFAETAKKNEGMNGENQREMENC